MHDNILIPLPGFTLPADFPRQVRFIDAVNEHLQRLRATGYFMPARFFGYYFRDEVPMAVSGSWTVTLDRASPVAELPDLVECLTRGQFTIASDSRNRLPDYMLVHDRFDGTCFLWAFEHGLRFVEATEPVLEAEDSGLDDVRDPKLLGP